MFGFEEVNEGGKMITYEWLRAEITRCEARRGMVEDSWTQGFHDGYLECLYLILEELK